MRFDPTVTWATIFMAMNFFLLVGLAYVGWVMFRQRVDLVLSQQEKVLTSIGKALTDHEDHDEKMFDNVAGRINELVGLVNQILGENRERHRQSAKG